MTKHTLSCYYADSPKATPTILLIHIFLFTIICKVLHAPFYLNLPYVWSLEIVRFDSRKGILFGGLGLNSKLCLLLHLPLLGFKRFIKRERERVDKGGVFLRKNKIKVFTAIGNYLNNSEGSGKADGELTNPCTCVTHTQYTSWCYHHDRN